MAIQTCGALVFVFVFFRFFVVNVVFHEIVFFCLLLRLNLDILHSNFALNFQVRGNSVLKESDIIIFGHTNGKNVKPGQKALQADSEFKFVVRILRP